MEYGDLYGRWTDNKRKRTHVKIINILFATKTTDSVAPHSIEHIQFK